ncbi:cardiolipin synthase [Halalkalibacter nanhaiisediminis]|uniref:Cardiolipin synthase n=1 Tax=Halalkalibacter nanhaiisediminis TaxID=688079 RepID=A0A562QSL9_9BACI|nr:cardiolipin synthase [Halalkalibacter nanhaiisediminis]TWI59749.1 cardiolipin synthase [Halalkalibacter nanhaiisediminis]
MHGFILSILIIITIIVWLRIDFVLGRNKQRQEATKHEQKTRYGEIELLPTGEEFFQYLLQDMQQATDHIHLLFYIFRSDHIGSKLISILEGKSREGVVVRILVDRFGCHISKKQLKQMKQAGIQFAYSHPPNFPFLFFTLNRRNHRKIAIADGRIGYIGGYNIGDEYLGRDSTFGFWRDFHLRIKGDGVQDLQEQFLQDWQTAKQVDVKEESHYPPLVKGPHPLRILPTDGVYLEDTFIDLVKQAKATIVIGTPYFIPGELLQQELIYAAKRGVDVSLILPKKADHPLVKEAAFPYLLPLVEAGVNVYQYYRGFFHAKSIVIDEQMCDVGTANFDKRSFHINHEINCLIYDTEIVQTVLKELQHDIAISERLTIEALRSRSLIDRMREKFATLVSGLL